MSAEEKTYWNKQHFGGLPANQRRISGRRFSPSGEKRRPEIRLRFACYRPRELLFLFEDREQMLQGVVSVIVVKGCGMAFPMKLLNTAVSFFL